MSTFPPCTLITFDWPKGTDVPTIPTVLTSVACCEGKCCPPSTVSGAKTCCTKESENNSVKKIWWSDGGNPIQREPAPGGGTSLLNGKDITATYNVPEACPTCKLGAVDPAGSLKITCCDPVPCCSDSIKTTQCCSAASTFLKPQPGDATFFIAFLGKMTDAATGATTYSPAVSGGAPTPTGLAQCPAPSPSPSPSPSSSLSTPTTSPGVPEPVLAPTTNTDTVLPAALTAVLAVIAFVILFIGLPAFGAAFGRKRRSLKDEGSVTHKLDEAAIYINRLITAAHNTYNCDTDSTY